MKPASFHAYAWTELTSSLNVAVDQATLGLHCRARAFLCSGVDHAHAAGSTS